MNDRKQYLQRLLRGYDLTREDREHTVAERRDVLRFRLAWRMHNFDYAELTYEEFREKLAGELAELELKEEGK